MRLAAPQMLWLLLILVPALILFFWWAWRKRQQLVTQFISARLLGHLKVGVSPSRQKARMALNVIAVVFVIVALARPQWGLSREEARQRGLDIIVAIDTSNSMLAQDVSPNRLARAKLAALDLMRRAKTDRLGLIAFAGDAFLECPLTLDDAAFTQSVNALDTHTISQGGTAIGEAIAEARKSFKNESDNHKVLVLFTDGEDHDSDAAAEAEKAAKDGMIIFTVGIGTPEGDQVRILDEHGRMQNILDENGKPVVSHLNEELLQQIATATKGFYIPLRGTKTMDMLYDRGIAPLPKSDNEVRLFQHFKEQYQLPLAIAILLLIAEIFLPDRSRRRSSRRSTATTSATTAVLETVTILLLLAIPMGVHASPASALREYNQGKYEEALKDYNQSLEKKKDDPRLHFNAGTAAYQAHQLDEASKQFNDALESPDLNLQQRAYYNLGNTLYRIGEQMPDAAKKQEAWENSMKQFANALKLNKQDADAKYNEEFVKKQLEELKKQQQSQQSQSDKNSKQNQKNQQDQNQQNQQNQDQKQKQDQQQNNQAQQNQNQSKSEQNSEANNQAKQKSEQEKEREQQQKQQQAQSQKSNADKQQQDAARQQAQAGQQDKDKSSEEAKREAAMMAAGEMTPRQA
ncbi:MAG TPA: VWA domain-containing protein, partial [Verrucomicrobiae bacterium]|nr:VWA domain-containing protein [Verrucomicrobiae bacterium]